MASDEYMSRRSEIMSRGRMPIRVVQARQAHMVPARPYRPRDIFEREEMRSVIDETVYDENGLAVHRDFDPELDDPEVCD